MLAIHLQSLLSELCKNPELYSTAYDDMEQRFRSLRACGCLPQGKENRAVPLTDEHIACAVLGLVVSSPEGAGLAVSSLKNLRPVGGPGRAFAIVETFLETIMAILTDKSIRETLVTVRISTSESGRNSPGYATIFYDEADTRKFTHYLRQEAVSLLQPGADEGYDPDRRYASFSREVTFNRRFFELLSLRVTQARIRPLPPPSDGSEYDAEEAERERLKYLGVTNSSKFINIGLETQATWPKREIIICFDKYWLVLMPMTKDYMQSVSIDLHENKLTEEEARTIINRFLSLLVWCDDQSAIAQYGWSGSPVPAPVPRRRGSWSPAQCWPFDRSIPNDKEVCRALAFYREARNAEINYMVSHAVLNYYKIIEIRYPEMNQKNERLQWIEDNINSIVSAKNPPSSVEDFLIICSDKKQQPDYIHRACRTAVSHASLNDGTSSDPDDANELIRLHVATGIMRLLARRLIRNELGVSDSIFCDKPDES